MDCILNRMVGKLWLFCFCLLLSSVGYASNQMEKQRALFIKAEKALSKKQTATFNQLSQQLTDYPLYPYLIYDDLTQRIDQLPNQEVEQFLTQYNTLPISQKLKENWLIALAEQQQWPLFMAHFKEPANNKLKCHYANALYQTGQQTEAFKQARSLWLVGYSQEDECDALFKQWSTAGLLTNELIWERFKLAMAKHNIRLAKYLQKKLTGSLKQKANLMLTVHRSPTKISDNALFKDNAPENQAIVFHGLKRLAKRDPQQATQVWPKLQKKYVFNDEQKQEIIEKISHGLMRKDPQQANRWFKKLDKKYLNENILAWQIRQALSEKNWPRVQQEIEELPKDLRLQPIWLYWYARSLEAQKMSAPAEKIYHHLAQYRNYYGFLAANQLKQPFAINHKSTPISKAQLKTIEGLTEIQRTQELYALNRYQEGNREWWQAMEKLTREEQYAAALLAKKQGWDNVALMTATKSQQKDDLKLRFPTLYSIQVNGQAKRNRINPALLYAIIRQESFFRRGATSHAGARGLMQLMPKTAVYIAQKVKHPYPYLDMLYDPTTNILLGSSYLQLLFDLYKGHAVLAIASYNAGPNRVKTWLPTPGEQVDADIWIETIPFTETREYVKYVMTYSLIYENQLGKKPNIKPYLQTIHAGSKK